MKISVHDGRATIDAAAEELLRLGLILLEGSHCTSRAEFYIRTGLSQPNAQEVAAAILDLSVRSAGNVSITVEEGVESVENPRRPRPTREDLLALREQGAQAAGDPAN